MIITTITVVFDATETINRTDIHAGTTLTATLTATENAAIAAANLYDLAELSVQEQFDRELERVGMAARYSTEPRYSLFACEYVGAVLTQPVVALVPVGIALPDGWTPTLEPRGMRLRHALRILQQYDGRCLILNCADGDVSRLPGAAPSIQDVLDAIGQAEDGDVADLTEIINECEQWLGYPGDQGGDNEALS